jgi:hypothetical protein
MDRCEILLVLPFGSPNWKLKAAYLSWHLVIPALPDYLNSSYGFLDLLTSTFLTLF